MGLDAVSYEHYKEVNLSDIKEGFAMADFDFEFDDYMYENGVYRVFSYTNFAEHALAGFSFARKDSSFYPEFFTAGPYVKTSGNVERVSNSYSGHSIYRKLLKEFGASAVDKDSPFYELMNFADNEGVLGPVACAALAEDYEKFPAFDPDSLSEFDYIQWAQRTHSAWKVAVENAANTGLLFFR